MRRRTMMIVGLLVVGMMGARPVSAESPREQAQKLMKVLRTDKKAEKRADAAERLGSLGASDAVPALAEALRDTDAQVRGKAAYSLWELKDYAGPSLAAIRAAVDAESDGRTILNEVALLRHLKVDAKALQPAVERALADSNFEVRLDAARQLVGDVDAMRLLPIAIEGVGEHSPEFNDSVGLLKDLADTNDRRLVAPLLDTARKGDKRQAHYASDYLLFFKPVPPDVLPILQRFLDSPDPEVREYGANSLERLGTDAKFAAPRLTQLLKDPSEDVRQEAAETLRGIGPAAQAAVPALIEAFQTTKKREAREACVMALSAMGAASKPAIPILRKELDNPALDGFLRNTIQRALTNLAP